MAGPKIGFRLFADEQRTLLGRRRRLILVGGAVVSHVVGKLLIADAGNFLEVPTKFVWPAEILFVFGCTSLWLYLSGKKSWRDRLSIRWGVYTGFLVSNPALLAAFVYAHDRQELGRWTLFVHTSTFLLVKFAVHFVMLVTYATVLLRHIRFRKTPSSVKEYRAALSISISCALVLMVYLWMFVWWAKLFPVDLFVFSYAAMVVWFRKKRRLWRIADVLGIMTWCCFYLAAARTVLVK
ncbi:MAG: hypothetical protein R3C28_10525 [Pirellulaceae bacterium]